MDVEAELVDVPWVSAKLNGCQDLEPCEIEMCPDALRRFVEKPVGLAPPQPCPQP